MFETIVKSMFLNVAPKAWPGFSASIAIPAGD